MSFKPLYNFGGVRFTQKSPLSTQQYNSILFTNGRGQITYIPIYNYDYETNTGKRIRSIKGYRVQVDITLLFLDDSDSSNLYTFLTLLNAQSNVGGIENPMWIYPRYDSTKPINDWYQVYYNGSISVSDIENINVGQVLNLSFESRELKTQLSTNISFAETTITDDGDNLLITTDSTDYTLTTRATDLTT